MFNFVEPDVKDEWINEDFFELDKMAHVKKIAADMIKFPSLKCNVKNVLLPTICFIAMN